MLSKADNYRQMIQKATKRIILFPDVDKQEKKSIVALLSNIKLPSSHSFRSSQQIENNTPITHHITHQSSKQYPSSPQNQWPRLCIGLILCEHHQNNQTFYVYGTGTLIHNNIVLTSAQNVYCRRLNTQYTNIRFIVGVSGDKCSGIYYVIRVNYPKEYTLSENYEDYNFAVIQLYNDLSDSCGYVGWKTVCDRKEVEKYTEYGYICDNKERFIKLRQIVKNEKSQYDSCCSGSGVLVKENQNKYSIVGIQHSAKGEGFIILSENIRNMINQWTHLTKINLYYNKIGPQGCKYLLSQANQVHVRQINLYDNNIGAQGCKYLSQANWAHLTQIDLYGNNIGAQACKYLSQANLVHLTKIDLAYNNINDQACKYLSQANWVHLIRIFLANNNIDAQGCKYLSLANWKHLTRFDLNYNQIDAQGCKYFSQTNWIYLRQIFLQSNNLDAQGCKHLSQANWTHLSYINLYNNDIKDIIIYRLLLLSSHPKTFIRI